MKNATQLALVLALLLATLFTYSAVNAQEADEAELDEISVTIPANGSADIPFQGFSLDFGEPFPTSFGQPAARADDAVLRVVQTAILNGSAAREPLPVNLAIWSLREDKPVTELYPNLDAAIAQSANNLLTQSANATVAPPATDQGIALERAVDNNQVEVTSADFAPDTTAPAPTADTEGQRYHGHGTMTIRNLTNEEITIYYPFGTVLRAAESTQQDLVTYATQLETQAPQPTSTAMATSTAQATGTVTVTVTTTPVMTVTATLVPTATVETSPTPELTPTATVEPMPTTTVITPQTMPQTGALPTDSNTAPLLIVAGLGLLGAAYLASRKR